MLYFTVLVIGITWPLVRFMGNSVVGEIGDNVYFIWLFGWFEKALFELKQNPFLVPQLNYPEGWSLAYTEIAPATLVLGYPAHLLGGPILGYNMSVLLTFILSGFFMNIWVYRLTGDWRAGLIAGTIYTCLPYRIAHYRAGHLNLMGTVWLPLYLMGFFEQLRGKGQSTGWYLLTGVSLGLIGLSSIYYLFMTVLVSVIVAIIYLVFVNRELIQDGRFWKGALASLAISLPIILPAILPFVLLEAEGGLGSRSVYSVIGGSASVSDFILPSTDHFLWGDWVGSVFPRQHWMEGTLYIGLISGILVILAWVGWRKRKELRRLIFLLSLTAAISFIIALGTHVHWMEEIVQLQFPESLSEILGRDSLGLRLPGFYLYQIVPMFSKIRVFKRFAVLGLTCITALAGLGSYWLIQKVQARYTNFVAAMILLLVLVDFYPGPFDTFSRVEARSVDYWLADQPGEGAVVQFPFDQIQDQDQIFNTLIHGKPFVGGFFNAFPPRQYLQIKPVLESFPDTASLELLKQLGVTYIVIDSSAYFNFALIQIELDSLGLREFKAFGDDYLYTIP